MDLLNDFDEVSLHQWKKKIESDLKGKDYNTLIWETEEGFSVDPIYHTESLKNNLSLNYNLTQNPVWDICEQINITSIEQANTCAIKALKGGANSIEFIGDIKTEEEMDILLKDIMIEIISIHFYNSSPENTAAFFNSIKEKRNINSQTNAIFSFDVLGEILVNGKWHINEQQDFALLKTSPHITISGNYYANSGANITQELAYTISQATEYINYLTDHGVNPQDAFDKLKFTLGISSNYFFEIAKIRAFKILWKLVAELYKVDSNPYIHSKTTSYNIAHLDAETNILRTTTEAMSAILGGCNALSIYPFDYSYDVQNDFTLRIARNIQNILKEESFFDKVTDVSKGSYYIEQLTDQIVKKSMELFKEIEKNGGFLKNIMNDNIQNNISNTHKNRLDKYLNNKKTLLGVNKHPNPKQQEKSFVQKNKPETLLLKPLSQINLANEILCEKINA